MSTINVTSEIKPLKEVLVHRPGKELLNLTPDTLHRLLFDDIPYLKVAQAEHDEFVQILRDNGVKVYYLENDRRELRYQRIVSRRNIKKRPDGCFWNGADRDC